MEKLMNQNTPAWRFQTWASFAISMVLMVYGIYKINIDWWIKGYLYMGLFFAIGSAFALAKTIRDDVETNRWNGQSLDKRQRAKMESNLE